MEELPDKSLPLTFDSFAKKDEQVFPQPPKNTINLSPKKKEIIDKNATKLANWNMFYHDLPLKSFIPDTFQIRNIHIVKTYRCQEEGILYIYRINNQKELWLTLLNMKTMIILSDFIIPMASSTGTLIRIKPSKTMFVVIKLDFVVVFRIKEKTRAIELIRWPILGINSQSIRLNSKYLHFSTFNNQYPDTVDLKVWDLNKLELLRSIHWLYVHQCWFYGDKFFILSWNQLVWTLDVHDLNIWNGKYRTVLTKKYSNSQDWKSVRLCLPYLIIIVSDPENCYLFFDCETLLPKFYLPQTEYSISKFYLAEDKFIITTFTGHSILLFFNSQEYKMDNERFGDYQPQKVVSLSSYKVFGKIYLNDWTICIPGGVFWVPSSNLFRLIDVYDNVAIYLQNKSLKFFIPIKQGIPEFYNTKEIQMDIENDELSVIHKIRQSYKLGDFKLTDKFDLTAPCYSIFYPIIEHRKNLLKNYEPIRNTLLPSLNLEKFKNEKFCIQVIQTIRRLTSQPLSIDEQQYVEKATMVLFEYLDTIFEASKFESAPHKWIHFINAYIIIIISITNEMEMIFQDSFRKRWDQFLSSYQIQFGLSYEAFLTRESFLISKSKQYFNSFTALKEFKTFQIPFDNLDQPTHYKNFYADTAKKIFEKQYNNLKKYLANRDALAHLPNITTPSENSVYSKIDHWEDVQKRMKDQWHEQILSYDDKTWFKSEKTDKGKESILFSVKNIQPHTKLNQNPENFAYCQTCQNIYGLLSTLGNKIQSTFISKEIENLFFDLREIENNGTIHFANDLYSERHMIHIKDLIQDRFKKLEKQLNDNLDYVVCANSILPECIKEFQNIENEKIFNIHIGVRLEEIKDQLIKYRNIDQDRHTAIISQIDALLRKIEYITTKPDKSTNDIEYNIYEEWDAIGQEGDEEFFSDNEEEEAEKEEEEK